MKQKNFLKKIWDSINLVDKFLIFMMILFLGYSIMTIYIEKANLEVIANIDIVVRTSIASIFGYFISSNFIKTGKTTTNTKTNNIEDNKTITHESTEIETTTSKIGFNVGEESSLKSTENNLGFINLNNQPDLSASNNNIQVQTLIVGMLCVMASLALVVTRFSITTTSNDAAALSQLRDIICGSVGFLIGTPLDIDNKSN